jgi:tRNA pseudouridine55 synthase
MVPPAPTTISVHGILLLDKPLHMSSAGAVARAKHLFRARKAGHTGSLDPLATGMLPVCFGEATKFGAQLLDADKTYRVSLRLGERTPSADLESKVIEKRELPPYSLEELSGALASFPRTYQQTPPMHSALKQDGKPLYAYARAGITRERATRAVTIHEMTVIAWQWPVLIFDVRCTKGAYIRVLGEDLAAHLGTIGHLEALRRLSVVPFDGAPIWSFDSLESLSAERLGELLLPVDAAISTWRRFDLPPDLVDVIRRGQGIALPEGFEHATPGPVRLYAAGLGFLGLGEVLPCGRLVPRRLISGNANEA